MARVRGNFKALLSRLPDSVEDEFRQQLNETGRVLLARARSRARVYRGRPRKGLAPGALQAGLSYAVPPKRLNLKVGIVGKVANRKLYYARFVEFGHRIGFRGRKLERLAKIDAKPGSTAYRLAALKRSRNSRSGRVRAYPFLYTMSRAEIYGPFQKIWGRALHRAAAGATDS